MLREKLAQLSLQQQQHYHRDEQHSIPQSIGITRAGKQRENGSTSRGESSSSSPSSRSSPRRLASSSKSHDSAAPHKANHDSLYKLSRGRSDHVSPSRMWDRRGASATVLSGASGSGSGGEDSEITLRPGRGRKVPVAQQQQQNAISARRASPYRSTNPTSTDASPTLLTTAATTPSPSLSRKSSFRRHNSALARWADNKPPSVAFGAEDNVREEESCEALDDEDAGSGHITSSDEEGADASRFARRRRVSLERDRRRGMRILLATGGDGTAFHVVPAGSAAHRGSSSRRDRRTSSERKRGCFDAEGDLRLTPTSETGSTFPSTSATPTTNGDDQSERSSLLSRSSSSDAADFAATTLQGLTPCTAGRRRRMHSAGENAEASIFGLADDENDHASALATHAEDADAGHDADADDSLSGQDAMPTSGALSSCALAAALTRRDSRSKSAARRTGALKCDKSRSTPASRRPSHPETSIPGASASSVPHRPTAILGFAPVTSSSASVSPYSTLPRRKIATALLPSKNAWLALSPKGAAAKQGDQSGLLDLLSGTSTDSVEDLILVDQVEWASDKEDTTGALTGNDDAVQARKADAVDSRRSSMISVRQGDMDRLECTGQPTVAALEAGSLLSAARSPDRGADSLSEQFAHEASVDATGLPPPSPTGTGGAIFSTQDPAQHPANDRQGFAAVYQDRISNLQSQLRLWSRDREHRTKTPSPERRSTVNGHQQNDDHGSDAALHASHTSSGLLASSWKQIARLPNLFFHAGSTAGGSSANNVDGRHQDTARGELSHRPSEVSMSGDSTVGNSSSGAATPLTHSSSQEADISSLTDNFVGSALSPASSPDSSGLILRSSSDNEMSPAASRDSRLSRDSRTYRHSRPSHGRSPSLGARGVVSPQDGDVDPGAYVTGLGHRIDPDVELASVVHMHASRAHRGRSVDTSRRHHSQAPRPHQHVPSALSQAPVHRATASDSESSPLISVKGDVEALLSKANAGGLESKIVPDPDAVPSLQLPPSVGPSNESSASSGETSTDTGLKATPSSALPRRTRSRARFTLHSGREEDDEDEEAAATSQSRAQDANAAAAASVSKSAENMDEEGFTTVRSHRARGRPGVSRPAAEAPVPVNYSAYADMSSSTSDDDGSQTVRARRSRSRARSSKDDVAGGIAIAMTPSASESSNSADGYASRHSGDEQEEDPDRQSPVRGRRGRGRGRGSRNNSPPAAARNRQCAIGLFSASNKTCRRDGAVGAGNSGDSSKSIAAATRSGLGVRSVRSSPDLTYAKVAATRVGQGEGRDGDSSSSRMGRQRGGRGAGRGTDDDEDAEDSSEDDRSRRGRERGVVKVTSSSFKESECPPNSLPRSASAGDFRSLSFSLSSPQAAASQSQAMQLRKQRLLASQSAASGVSSQGSDSSSDGSLGGAAPSCSVSAAAGGSSPGSSTSGSLMSQPNRPTLLSNSAHLLMLSLELEMMRAQKISAPLRIRWARQRTISATATMTIVSDGGDGGDGSAATAVTTETDPDVCATSGSDASAVALPPTPPPSAAIDGTRDPAKGNPLYSSLSNARQLYGQTYRPRQASQLRNVVNA